jgi:hypothetical protein
MLDTWFCIYLSHSPSLFLSPAPSTQAPTTQAPSTQAPTTQAATEATTTPGESVLLAYIHIECI